MAAPLRCSDALQLQKGALAGRENYLAWGISSRQTNGNLVDLLFEAFDFVPQLGEPARSSRLTPG